jgi:hypothetical protein
MPSLAKRVKPTKLQEVPSTFPSKIIYMEEILQDMNKQMLETSYTLNLGQLTKITPNLKKYLWQKLKANKPYINTRPMNEKATSYVVPNINITTIFIDNHMDVIQLQIGENMIDDVLLDGGLG